MAWYRAKLLALTLFFSCGIGWAQTTRYVDPADGTCSNANDGTSAADPWCVPPGTRNAANSADLNTRTDIACGDTIELAAGSTQTSTEGGKWAIDSSTAQWPDCGAGSPVTLQVTGTGDFTIDGTGVTTAGAGEPALLAFINADNIHIRGNSATNEFIVRDSDDDGIEIYDSERIFIQNFRSTTHTDYGVAIGGNTASSDISLETGRIDNNSSIGLLIGYQSDHTVNRFLAYNIEIDNNGPVEAACASEGGGVHITGLGLKTLHTLDIHDNTCEGLQSGVITDGNITTDWIYRYRDLQVYSHDSRTNNQAGANHQMSGDENGTTPSNNSAYTFGDGNEVINAVRGSRFHGAASEQFQAGHGGGVSIFVNNTVAVGEGSGSLADQASDYQAIVNTILCDEGNFMTRALETLDSSAGAYNVSREILLDYSSFYTDLATAVISDFDQYCSTTTTQGCIRDDDCPGGETCDKVELGTDHAWNALPEFITDNTNMTTGTAGCGSVVTTISGNCSAAHPFSETDYDSCDLTLAAGASNEIDGGTPIMVTTNSGTNSTGPVNLRWYNSDDSTNYGSAYQLDNPLLWFYDCDVEGDDADAEFMCPTNSNFAPGDDTIEIGGTENTITDVTSTGVTLGTADTWNVGDTVHWPYNGAGPDRGYAESGAAADDPFSSVTTQNIITRGPFRIEHCTTTVNVNAGTNVSQVTLPTTGNPVHVKAVRAQLDSGAGAARSFRFKIEDPDGDDYGVFPEGGGYTSVSPGDFLTWSGDFMVPANGWIISVEITGAVDDEDFTWEVLVYQATEGSYQ